MKFNNTRLLVAKFDEVFLFYRDMLGFTVTWGTLGESYAQFQTGISGTLGIFNKKIMASLLNTSHLPQTETQDKFVLVFEVDNVDILYNSLAEKGLLFINVPTDQSDWGYRVVHMRDPEGNLLEFISELPKK